MVITWRRPVAAIAAVTALATMVMMLTGMGPRLVAVAGLGALIGATAWMTAALWAVAAPAEPWGVATPAASTSTDWQVSVLRSRIGQGPRNPGSAERLRVTLVELIDDRLEVEHHVDRHSNPDAARAILGDDLFRLVTDPDTARSLTRLRTVERVVDRIEQI